jgi:phenylalanyl-tRNA synthetase beta chain
MEISYKWLKNFIKVDESPKELAAEFTQVGLECDTVEEVEMIKGGLRGVVIGKVLTCEVHPNSDHLHITTCDLGTGEPVQIVCGAPNVAAGQTVVVATVGTTLYDGDNEIKIKKSKIRGVESFGMICAEDELGIGTDHAGIMVLKEDIKPGTPAAEYFNIESDYRLEVELTPNRVDGASHLGVARDLKALKIRNNYGKDAEEVKLNIPSVAEFKVDKNEGAEEFEVIDTEGAPRYSGVTIRGVEVKESPEWLKELLIASGQRPINNIVDITNYILLGIGQPLHCFDLDKVKGKIIVKTCEEGTPFTTLDGVERKLSSADLMICDEEKPLCIAGVFGGLDSGVTESTKNVFIESAYFNPTRIRKSARRHGLSTDASFRYERGIDPNILPYAAKLAAVLIKELAGGEICGDIKDSKPEGFAPFDVTLGYDYCNKLIGKKIEPELIKVILRALEIEVVNENKEELQLQVPRYRVDVTRPCDVVEEVLRIYGYNNVEINHEMHVNLSQQGETDAIYALQNNISEYLTGNGFREIMNNSLTRISYYEDNNIYKLEESIQVMNPLSRDLGVMRRTLLYGGLESLSRNVNRKATDLKFYEFGNVYNMNPAKESTQETPLTPYSESFHLGIWMTGNITSAGWNTKAAEVSFFDLKSIVENILIKSGIDLRSLKFEQGKDDIYTAKLIITTNGGKLLGEAGILRKALLKKFDIEADTVYAELDWKLLYKLSKSYKCEFTPLPKTQPVRRDLALLLDKNISFAQVEDVIRKSERRLLKDVGLFDVYDGKGIPEGKKSYAVWFTLQDSEKTLNDKQIDAIMNKIITQLKNQLQAELR